MGEGSRSSGGLARLILLGIVWGATFPMSRLGVAAGADPFVLVTIAFALAVAVTAPVAALKRNPLPSLRGFGESAAVGALLIAGINLPLFWGERFATGGAASIVYATAPLVSLAFGTLLGSSERVGRRELFALVLGVAGVAVLALAAGGVVTSLWGLAAFGLGAVCQGTGAVTLGRLRPHGESVWGQTAQFAGGGVAALAVALAMAPRFTISWSAPVLASVAYVGIASLAVGYAVFFDLIRRDGPVRANQVTFLNPVVAVTLGAVVFAEPFALVEVGGLVLILLALAILRLPSTGRAPATGREPAEGTPPSTPSVRGPLPTDSAPREQAASSRTH